MRDLVPLRDQTRRPRRFRRLSPDCCRRRTSRYATAAPFATSRREAAVAVTVWIRQAPQPEASSRAERIEVVASIYDTRGEMKATSRESVRSAAVNAAAAPTMNC